MSGSYKTSLNQLARSSLVNTFNTLTATGLTINGRTETNRINCQDYLSATWGCTFQSNPITVFTTPVTIPLFLLPGEGQNGPYDAGNNLIKFPANGTYLFEFTCISDNIPTTYNYTVTLNGSLSFSNEVSAQNTSNGDEWSGYRVFFSLTVFNFQTDRASFTIQKTGGVATQLTNFFISQGHCIQAAAFI